MLEGVPELSSRLFELVTGFFCLPLGLVSPSLGLHLLVSQALADSLLDGALGGFGLVLDSLRDAHGGSFSSMIVADRVSPVAFAGTYKKTMIMMASRP